MKATDRSLEIAEAQYDHKLQMGTSESRKSRHNVAKDTEYDFDPQLDLDIRNTKKNLADTEKNLKHKWVIEDLQSEADLRTQAEAEAEADIDAEADIEAESHAEAFA